MGALRNITKYFDLNNPYPFSEPAPSTPAIPATPRAPQSIAAAVGPSSPTTTTSAPAQSGMGWQVATYCIVVVSIVASRFCDLYRVGALGSFTFDFPYLLFLAIVSLVAFPVVYTRTALNVQDSVFVRIALIFTAGMGWEKIVSTAIGK